MLDRRRVSRPRQDQRSAPKAKDKSIEKGAAAPFSSVPRRPRGRPATPDVEDRLLRAMERLLGDGRPFGSISVETLAREAGLARATFYLHFKDKGALVARLLARISDEVVHSGGAWFEDARGSGPEQIHAAIDGIVRTFKRHHAVLAAVADTAPFDPLVAGLHGEMMERLCRASRKAMAVVRAEGRAAPLADNAMADMLSWIVELYCTRFAGRSEGREFEALIDRLAQICASAIFAPGADQVAGSIRSRRP